MEGEALDIIDRLVREDDSSVEAWYLGGWCQYLLADKQRDTIEKTSSKLKAASEDATIDQKRLLSCSRRWLLKSIQLYEMLEYEDERLRDHAAEITSELNHQLGPPMAEDEAAEDEEAEEEAGWEDIEDTEELMYGDM